VALPLDPLAAGLARKEVRGALSSWGLEWLEDTALLLVSELVGNAVRHARLGGSELRLRVADTGAWLRVEVVDADPHLPQLHVPAGLDESGFGLVLVEALAAKWGVDQAAVGKTVWIELDAGRGEGNGGIPALDAASVCRNAAALIHELGWDPLAETWNTAGPLPMDVAIFSATEAGGYERPDDILDVVLTHVAGLLYAAGEVTRQTLVHDMTDVAMAWEARPGRTAEEVLGVLELTASILDQPQRTVP
jgi:anti-sigma regulatory factor (Ser/Thr protein kinase)